MQRLLFDMVSRDTHFLTVLPGNDVCRKLVGGYPWLPLESKMRLVLLMSLLWPDCHIDFHTDVLKMPLSPLSQALL